MSYQVSLVPPTGLPAIWNEVKPLLERVLPTTEGRYELPDVVNALNTFSHHLWIAVNEDTNRIDGIVTTTFVQYPRKKALAGLLCAGTNIRSWMEPMLGLLDIWAEDNKCDLFEMVGRKGWARLFRDYGWRVSGQVHQKDY